MTDANDSFVVFEPHGRRVPADPEISVLELARGAGLDIESVCGGEGRCGQCRVRVQADLPPPGVDERAVLGPAVAEGFRLACRVIAPAGSRIWIPPESARGRPVILTTGVESDLEMDPAVRAFEIEVPPAELGRVVADRERVLDQTGLAEAREVRFGLAQIKSLESRLTEGQGRLTAVIRYGRDLLDLRPGWIGHPLGLAVDLGTTTVVATLVDLATGQTLAVQADANPQIAHGEDVISRISFAEKEADGRAVLAREATSCLNQLIRNACREAGVEPGLIFEAVVVGNTAMHHLLLGLNATPLARTPYVPAVSEALDVTATELGLNLAPGAMVHLLPVKAGFVGADSVAVALAVGADSIDEPTLIVDLGTNGELILVHEGRLWCCSTAAGPAFEGGHVSGGMRAARGAVDRVRLDERDLTPELSVIGRTAPVGLCGSGLVSLAAELIRVGAVKPAGGFSDKLNNPRLRRGGRGGEFLLVTAAESGSGRDLVLTAKDISELQLAKAAVAAGARILLDQAGLDVPSRVILAGAFGNYLDPADACVIGLFPGVDPETVQGVGNAAAVGAVMALLSVRQRRRARDLARKMRYIELAAHPEFADRFTDALRF
jgi:uncharacterized 2Fe-2S/4Fe-4S cluster protein (DUF4445 family)